MQLRSDAALYSRPVCEGSCLGKGNGSKGERGREKNPTIPNSLIPSSLWFFLLCFHTLTWQLKCLVDFPGCLWAKYYTKHPSLAVVSQHCLISPLCVRQKEILFHASFINSLLGFYKLLHLPVLVHRLKTKRYDCTDFFCGNWSQMPHDKLLLMAKANLILNTRLKN